MNQVELILSLLYFIEVIGFFMIGSLVILRKRNKLYQGFAIFTYLVGLWQLLQFGAQLVSANHDTAIALLRASIVVSGPMAASFLLFARLYTGRKVYPFLYLCCGLLVGLLTLFSKSLLDVRINYLGIGVPHVDLWYGVLLVFGGLCILGGVFSISMHLKQSKDKKRKKQDLILLLSVLLAGTLVVLFSFYTSDFSSSIIAQHIIPIACLMAVASFSYVIYHGLFDIHFFVVRALAYVSTLFMLAIFFVTPTVAIFVALSPSITLSNLPIVVVVCVILLYLLQYLRRVFDKITGRFFFRQFYNPQDVLDRLSGVLARTIDIDIMRRNSTRVLAGALKPNFVRFLLYKSTSNRTQKLVPLIEKLPFSKSNVIVVDALEDVGERIALFQQERIAAVVRLRTAQEDIGYLVLGFKRSGEAYAARDVRLLNTAADELALAIQNALRFEEIERFNERLQREVEEATAELRLSNKKLKALDEAKDEFISMASHQLRTPLTSVKGYVSMVLDGDAGVLTKDQRKLLQEAYASSQRMVYMIADFLNVSRLKTGKFLLEPSTVSLPEIVKEEVVQLSPTAAARGITVETHMAGDFPPLRLDETKIRQVIMNFIDNAIFYSNSGGDVTVFLEANDKEMTFKVKDNGIGVPASEQPRVFSKFFRATNARHVRPDGTGIGLFMAKKVVTAHGGDMIFETKENKGSTFGFRLPLKAKLGQ